MCDTYTYNDPLCMVERRDPERFHCENIRMHRWGEATTHLIPDEPLTALNGENGAEDAHGGTPAARTSGARVRDGDGLGGGIGRVLGALLALVAFLWIASLTGRAGRGFRGLVLVRLDVHEPRGLVVVGRGRGRGGGGRGRGVGVRERVLVRGVTGVRV